MNQNPAFRFTLTPRILHKLKHSFKKRVFFNKIQHGTGSKDYAWNYSVVFLQICKHIGLSQRNTESAIWLGNPEK